MEPLRDKFRQKSSYLMLCVAIVVSLVGVVELNPLNVTPVDGLSNDVFIWDKIVAESKGKRCSFPPTSLNGAKIENVCKVKDGFPPPEHVSAQYDLKFCLALKYFSSQVCDMKGQPKPQINLEDILQLDNTTCLKLKYDVDRSSQFGFVLDVSFLKFAKNLASCQLYCSELGENRTLLCNFLYRAVHTVFSAPDKLNKNVDKLQPKSGSEHGQDSQLPAGDFSQDERTPQNVITNKALFVPVTTSPADASGKKLAATTLLTKPTAQANTDGSISPAKSSASAEDAGHIRPMADHNTGSPTNAGGKVLATTVTGAGFPGSAEKILSTKADINAGSKSAGEVDSPAKTVVGAGAKVNASATSTGAGKSSGKSVNNNHTSGVAATPASETDTVTLKPLPNFTTKQPMQTQKAALKPVASTDTAGRPTTTNVKPKPSKLPGPKMAVDQSTSAGVEEEPSQLTVPGTARGKMTPPKPVASGVATSVTTASKSKTPIDPNSDDSYGKDPDETESKTGEIDPGSVPIMDGETPPLSDNDSQTDDSDLGFADGMNPKPNDNAAGELPAPQFPEYTDSHFFTYFLTVVVLCIIVYLVFHNKQKIIALIIEGRHERRRRPNTANYKKLDCNLEEVMQGSTKGVTTAHVIY